MFQITINEKGGPAKQESFDKTEITIGRVQGNDVILPKGNISKRHSRIVLKDNKFIIVDLKSTNGTYVNGKKITAPQVVKSTDKIYIGDFTLQLQPSNGAAPAPEPVEASPRGRSAAADEGIDLFGGDAADDEPEPAGGGVPGLIDDNFDQEFDAPDPAPKLPKPKRASRLPEPEPEPEPEPDLEPAAELDLGGEDFDDADLDGDCDLPEPEPEPDLEPEPEPEPPRAAVVPMKKKASARGAPSRVRPSPKRAEPEPEPDDFFDDAPEDDFDDAPQTALPSAAPVAPLAPAAPVAAVAAAAPMDREEAVRLCHLYVVDALGLAGMELSALPSQRSRAVQIAEAWVARQQRIGRIDPLDAEDLAEEAASLAVDLSLVLDLVQDETVVEIAVTHDRQVLADREGRLEPIDRMISSEDQVVALIRRLAALGGQSPTAEHPLVDVRLRDGARVVASLPPLSFRGPTLSYRKTTRDFYTLDRLFEEYSTISEGMLRFIDYCVRFKQNLLLSVAPGVTPTATMNALVAQMAPDERIVSIETGIELHLASHKNVTALERCGDINDAQLVDHALALQADRIVIGSLAGSSCGRVLEAIAGPLEGSVAGYSASTPEAALDRIAKRELAPALGGDVAEARRIVAQAFPVVLQEQKFLDNSRRITKISEILVDDGEVRVQDIFQFKPEGVDENQIVTGSFSATGHVPRFLEELVDRGEADVDMDIFKS
ncbi:MAG: ATPase, T2SS/T4P/T4SS family [Deltaproteobacteria bacterium]